MTIKLSFKKRISIVKANVCMKVIESKELSKLGSGTTKSGYYSLSTIIQILQPELLLNDLDLDIKMFDNKVVGVWIDCQDNSDLEKEVEFDLTRLSNIILELKRLPQMQNEIQTEGSIKTYFRRYALTSFLNLPATDEIDSNNDDKKQKNIPQKQGKNFEGLNKEQLEKLNNFDNNIINFILSKKSNYGTLEKVPSSFFNDLYNQAIYYTEKKNEKTNKETIETKAKKEVVTKNDILEFTEIIKSRLLDINKQNLIIKSIYNLKTIMDWDKEDFIKYRDWIKKDSTNNKDIENALEIFTKKGEKAK